MPHAMHARHLRAGTPPRGAARRAPSLLYKADHPRAIDQHIRYFGDLPALTPERDVCGEALLEETPGGRSGAR